MEGFKRDIDPNHLFRFRFKSHSMSDNMAYFVLSESYDTMIKFLKQHNFEIDESCIDIVDAEENRSNSEFLLEEYIFKSNYSDQLYKITTTEHLVYDCGEYVCDMISSALIFGSDTIVRQDIPIMVIISDLIFKLDHVYVMDHTLCNSSGKPFSSAWEQFTKIGYPEVGLNERLSLQDEPAAYDDTGIFNSVSASIGKGFPLPFTLECYISYFISLLTDSYN